MSNMIFFPTKVNMLDFEKYLCNFSVDRQTDETIQPIALYQESANLA